MPSLTTAVVNERKVTRQSDDDRTRPKRQFFYFTRTLICKNEARNGDRLPISRSSIDFFLGSFFSSQLFTVFHPHLKKITKNQSLCVTQKCVYKCACVFGVSKQAKTKKFLAQLKDGKLVVINAAKAAARVPPPKIHQFSFSCTLLLLFLPVCQSKSHWQPNATYIHYCRMLYHQSLLLIDAGNWLRSLAKLFQQQPRK